MQKKSKRTLADLRAVHDRRVSIPAKIRAAIEQMRVSGSQWEYEEGFRKLSGLSPVDVSEFRDEFTDFWAIMPPTNGKRSARRVWFAAKKLADEWKAL